MYNEWPYGQWRQIAAATPDTLGVRFYGFARCLYNVSRCPAGASSVRGFALTASPGGKLLAPLHAFFGHQEHRRANGQDAADHIEHGGTDTTGGGHFGAGFVFNLNFAVRYGSFAKLHVACVINRNRNGVFQLVITLGSFFLRQIVSIRIQTLDGEFAVIGCGDVGDGGCGFVSLGNTVCVRFSNLDQLNSLCFVISLQSKDCAS